MGRPGARKCGDRGSARELRCRPRTTAGTACRRHVDSPAASDPAALPLPGPTLILRRDERVAVDLVNQSHEPAAVHWHGIELESWADGVPGWSGPGDRILPAIPPGDSLTVGFTPDRAGELDLEFGKGAPWDESKRARVEVRAAN